MKIDFNDCSVLSADFTKHICVTVLKYFIDLEKQIIKGNKSYPKIVKSSKKDTETFTRFKKKNIQNRTTKNKTMITGNELITITIEDPTRNLIARTSYLMRSAMYFKNKAREFHMENLDFIIKEFEAAPVELKNEQNSKIQSLA